MMREMTDAETAAHLRKWVAASDAVKLNRFAWATDACGYRQHCRFADHRNAHWQGQTEAEFDVFLLAYADMLDPPAPVEAT